MLVVSVACLLVLLLWHLAAPYAVAAAFVLDISGASPWIRRMLPVRVQPVSSREVQVPTRHGPIAARLYEPAAHVKRSVLVFPGIHPGGVDEPRLATFAARLAATGIRVLSAPLPELRQYVISPASTDVIEDVTAWTAADRSLAPGGRVTLAGVSFAGGLVLVAAGRPRIADQVELVVALGAHADLPRVMRYLCTGRLPDGSIRPPHDYGAVLLLLRLLPELVPADQEEAARATVLKFLEAGSAAGADLERGLELAEQARAMAARLEEPARTWLRLVNDRDTAALGERLLPYTETLGGAPALSPARSPATHAPVFLMHGEADNVIPSTETPLLADYLSRHGNPQVRWLLTPLLSHADVQARTPGETWRLIAFWKDLLNTE